MIINDERLARSQVTSDQVGPIRFKTKRFANIPEYPQQQCVKNESRAVFKNFSTQFSYIVYCVSEYPEGVVNTVWITCSSRQGRASGSLGFNNDDLIHRLHNSILSKHFPNLARVLPCESSKNINDFIYVNFRKSRKKCFVQTSQ